MKPTGKGNMNEYSTSMSTVLEEATVCSNIIHIILKFDLHVGIYLMHFSIIISVCHSHP